MRRRSLPSNFLDGVWRRDIGSVPEEAPLATCNCGVAVNGLRPWTQRGAESGPSTSYIGQGCGVEQGSRVRDQGAGGEWANGNKESAHVGWQAGTGMGTA